MSRCLSEAKVNKRVDSCIFNGGVDTRIDKRLATSEVLLIGCDILGVNVE